jgi:hypothetical protein
MFHFPPLNTLPSRAQETNKRRAVLRKLVRSAALTLLATGTCVQSALAAPFSFNGIGVFSSPDYADSQPNGISADGQWVVGRAQTGFGSDALRLFRWSQATGLQDLGSGVGGVDRDHRYGGDSRAEHL